jgi:YspA, cpYpsA-related SLOG family
MRVLICGPRDFDNALYVFCVAGGLFKRYGRFTLVHGAANGVDTLAEDAASILGCDIDPYPADWSKGRSAGPQRNREMLEKGEPELVVAIGYGSGTANMVRQARSAGVPVEWRASWWVGNSAKPK